LDNQPTNKTGNDCTSEFIPMKPIPAWLQRHLDTPPAVGTGLHRWIYRTACLLSEHHSQDASAIASLLQQATANAARDTTREIEDAVQAALSKGSGAKRNPASPKRDDRAVATALQSGTTWQKLHAMSPAPCLSRSKEILPLLFPGDPLLCIGFRQEDFDTLPLSEWLGILQYRPAQFIVPSAMTSRSGLTQQGKPSPKTKANTGPRHYLVVEFDFQPDSRGEDALLLQFGQQFGLQDTRDLCAAIAYQLGQQAPLALVLWSGGKSLHCWFPAHGISERQQRLFFEAACRLGADPATWTASQFVRLPWGWNVKKQQRQEVIYFAPSLLPQTQNQTQP
jgi:hypothetical protein